MIHCCTGHLYLLLFFAGGGEFSESGSSFLSSEASFLLFGPEEELSGSDFSIWSSGAFSVSDFSFWSSGAFLLFACETPPEPVVSGNKKN